MDKAATLPNLSETLVSAKPNGILELDELWLYVGKSSNKSWAWIALCRRTRQSALGKHLSPVTDWILYGRYSEKLPEKYSRGLSLDSWY